MCVCVVCMCVRVCVVCVWCVCVHVCVCVVCACVCVWCVCVCVLIHQISSMDLTSCGLLPKLNGYAMIYRNGLYVHSPGDGSYIYTVLMTVRGI